MQFWGRCKTELVKQQSAVCSFHFAFVHLFMMCKELREATYAQCCVLPKSIKRKKSLLEDLSRREKKYAPKTSMSLVWIEMLLGSLLSEIFKAM